MAIIVKKDGTSESFNIDKLVTSITKSGVPITESVTMANGIKTWIEGNLDEGKIASEKIKDKIIEILLVNYPVEADNFKTYKK